MSDSKLTIARARFNLFLEELNRHSYQDLSFADIEAMYYTISSIPMLDTAMPIGLYRDGWEYWVCWFCWYDGEEGGFWGYHQTRAWERHDDVKIFQVRKRRSPDNRKALDWFYQRYSEQERLEICQGFALWMGWDARVGEKLDKIITYEATDAWSTLGT